LKLFCGLSFFVIVSAAAAAGVSARMRRRRMRQEKHTPMTVTPHVIVQVLPQRNQYWKIIGSGEKCCELRIGVGT
jgi:hypothetical protein